MKGGQLQTTYHCKQHKWVNHEPPHQRLQLLYGTQDSVLNVVSGLAEAACDMALEDADCILEAFATGRPDSAWSSADCLKEPPAPGGASHCNRHKVQQQQPEHPSHL